MAASKCACASFNIGSSTTITITKDKNSYTHTITYTFGSATGTIATKTSNTSIAWNPTASTLYAQMTNVTRRSGTITCQTYDGNTLIGTTTATFYASAVKEDCLPTITATIVDTNATTIALTGDSSKMICYMSKPKVTMTITPKYSASIVSKQIYNYLGGLLAFDNTYTFDTVYSEEWRCTATDSRGYTNTASYKTGFVEYEPVHFNTTPKIKRTESTSTTATIKLEGYCFKGSFGVASNTLTVKYRYKTSVGSYGSYVTITPTWNADGTFTANVNVSNLSLAEQYTFEVIAQDKLTSFGDGEEILLAQGMGDLRIAKDYILAKNNIIIGEKTNTVFKDVKLRRNVNNIMYNSNFGIGSLNNEAITTVELSKAGILVGKMDLRADGHLYNYFSNMSVAEIMSFAPSSTVDGQQGYFLLNGGNSQPILVQWGRVNITPTAANTPTIKEIYYNYPFVGYPIVKTEKISGDPSVVDACAYNVNNNRFSICVRRTNTVATSVMWVAIGNGTNALPE